MNDGLLWFAGSLLLAFALLCATCNLRILVAYFVRQKENSMVPFIGGLSGTLGMLLVPVSRLRRWCWLPLILDVGNLPIAFELLRTFLRSGKQ
jgi:hypothetical protein